MTAPDDPRPPAEARPPRWYQRVLPTTLLGVAVLVAAVLAVPGFRDQVALSVTHRPERYVELYFGAPAVPSRPTGCVRRDGSVLVRFTVASHLRDDASLAARVVVDPDGPTKPLHRKGKLPVAPGQYREVTVPFHVPGSHGYRVAVVLPGLDQALRADCPGRNR
jgi:hypothetical protein